MSQPSLLSEGTVRRPSRTGWFWGIAFVVVSLLALVLVPVYLGQKTEAAQRRTVEVIEPARALATHLALIQARQMSRFQAFLLTGDGQYEKPYKEAHREENDSTARLQGLIKGMDLGVRERLANLSTLSYRWYLGHLTVFDSPSARRQVLAHLSDEQAQYDQLQQAAIELEGAIQDEMDKGRALIERTRTLQADITIILALLALGATLIVGVVGIRLRILTIEAESRRGDSLRARRDIDALMDATSDGVLGIDLEGRCISLNRAGSELLGFSEWQIRGRDVHDTVYHSRPDGSPRSRDASLILRALHTSMRARSPDGDVLWRRKGDCFPAQWTLRPLVDGTEVRGGVLTFTDMTEIREKEDALKRALRARDEVVSIVSHDLRNPLGVVTAAADLILDLPLSEPERRKQAEIIRRSAARMARLIQDLLDVARIEAGALRVRPDVHEPETVLEETRLVFEPQATERGISMDVHADEGVPCVRIDRDRVVQALTNLVANALKFTPRGGRITVTASARDAMVAFSVTDTGPGIPEEARERLFDRFWRGDRNDRRGAGLGLAIVRGIAEAHGGTVEVASQPGEGATFTILLPSADVAEPDPVQERAGT